MISPACPDRLCNSVPAVLYAAKSTADEHGSIPTQLADCRAMAARERWRIEAEFQDEGFSAYKRSRGPGLEAARARAAELAAEFGSSVLVAQHSDRFARGSGDGPDAAEHLVEVLCNARRQNVQLRSVQDDANLLNTTLAAMIGERNFEDSRRKSEAIRAGKRREAERGEWSGPAPYGYCQNGRTLKPVEHEAEVVCRIFREFLAGRSQKQIAEGLNADGITTKRDGPWRQSGVKDVLHSRVYLGKVPYKGEEFEGQHPAIVSAEVWEETAALLEAKRRTPSGWRGRSTLGTHLFARGLLRCSCGSAMAARSPSNGRGGISEHYVCAGRLDGSSPDCTMPTIPRVAIDEPAFALFESIGLDVEGTRAHFAALTEQESAETRARLAHAEQEQVRLRAELERAEADYLAGTLSAGRFERIAAKHEDSIAAAQAQAEQLRTRLDALDAELASEQADAEAETLRHLAEVRASVAGLVSNASNVEEARAAILRLFERFTLQDATAEINTWPELQRPRFSIVPEVRPEACIAACPASGTGSPFREKVALKPKTNPATLTRIPGIRRA